MFVVTDNFCRFSESINTELSKYITVSNFISPSFSTSPHKTILSHSKSCKLWGTVLLKNQFIQLFIQSLQLHRRLEACTLWSPDFLATWFLLWQHPWSYWQKICCWGQRRGEPSDPSASEVWGLVAAVAAVADECGSGFRQGLWGSFQ